MRGLADYRRANKSARAVAALFSCGRDDVAEHAAQLVEENKELRRQVRALEEVAAEVEAQRLLSPGVVQPDGTRIVARVFEDRDAEFLKKIAHALISHPRTVALLGCRDKDTARLVFARSADTPGDMNALMREACALLDGRGGGKPEMAQGGGKNVERLQEAIDRAVAVISKDS
jgi:alanyl-tRNA synthetase